jgi:hypothetical protein
MLPRALMTGAQVNGGAQSKSAGAGAAQEQPAAAAEAMTGAQAGRGAQSSSAEAHDDSDDFDLGNASLAAGVGPQERRQNRIDQRGQLISAAEHAIESLKVTQMTVFLSVPSSLHVMRGAADSDEAWLINQLGDTMAKSHLGPSTSETGPDEPRGSGRCSSVAGTSRGHRASRHLGIQVYRCSSDSGPIPMQGQWGAGTAGCMQCVRGNGERQRAYGCTCAGTAPPPHQQAHGRQAQWRAGTRAGHGVFGIHVDRCIGSTNTTTPAGSAWAARHMLGGGQGCVGCGHITVWGSATGQRT